MNGEPLSRQTGTDDFRYAERLKKIQASGWRRWLNVQAPYRWNIRRLEPGFTLDIGAGVGRNLLHLGGHGIGVDHNPDSVRIMRAHGLRAYLPGEFAESEFCAPGVFDSLLLAHVLEHMDVGAAGDLVAQYLPLIRSGGRIIVITPQEAGFRSDATHVHFFDTAAVSALLSRLNLAIDRAYSFPFPRWVGHLFLYNEFVVVGRV